MLNKQKIREVNAYAVHLNRKIAALTAYLGVYFYTEVDLGNIEVYKRGTGPMAEQFPSNGVLTFNKV